jgi:uncharacterized membrane protein
MKISPRGCVLTALLCLLLTAGCGGEAPKRDPRVLVEGTTVRVVIDDIDSRQGKLFTYVASSGPRVLFHVYRESSGTYRAVLDACRKCYRWSKGYRMREGSVVCRKCGETFDIDSLSGGRGSCIPIPLTSSLEGNSLVIPASELEDGKQYF